MDKTVIRVFDNKNRTDGRYTIVINGKVVRMSDCPKSGVNTLCGVVGELRSVAEALTGKVIKDIGEELELLKLPLEVRLAIGDWLKK